MTHLPAQIGEMKSLQVLNVNQNDLVDLPNGIFNLPLRLFGIDDNPLDEIPPEVVEGGSQAIFDYLGSRNS